MINYRHSENSVDVAAPYNVSSGGGCKVGGLFGIAIVTVLSGATVTLKCTGAWDIAKHATDTFAVGDAVYWDDTNKYVTSTSSGNTKIGYATKAAGGSDATAAVRLNGWI